MAGVREKTSWLRTSWEVIKTFPLAKLARATFTPWLSTLTPRTVAKLSQVIGVLNVTQPFMIASACASPLRQETSSQ